MPDPDFDHFLPYAELTEKLFAVVHSRPDLMSIQSIGKSHEGRDIWCVTVTSSATGPAAEKPAFWVDGNIHATELSASSACLYFLKRLSQEYGSNPDITHCLDTRAFYVVPRLNPDGAE
ncbi:MAG: M14 family zinc carboxypeptidase, partial [Armatimonadota bacterium]